MRARARVWQCDCTVWADGGATLMHSIRPPASEGQEGGPREEMTAAGEMMGPEEPLEEEASQ